MNQSLPIISQNEHSEYIINIGKIHKFINYFTKGSKFAFLLNFGFIQQGKSTFSQKLSSVKHEIGNEIQPKTKGALITYCGTVQYLINKFKIKQNIATDKKLHIFNIDTEGITDNKNENNIISLFPLIQICSVIIIYGRSFTDSTIIPYIDGIYHLSNVQIIITLKNSHEIIDKNIDSIVYYIDKAKSSDLWEKLTLNKIPSEIIPCIDFRDICQNKISNQMNIYMISRILNLMNLIQWDDVGSFIKHLKSLYSDQNQNRIRAVFHQETQLHYLLDAIKDDILFRIDQQIQNSDQNNIEIYDQLIQEATSQFDEICCILKIDKENKYDFLKSITNSIMIKKMNAQFIENQKNEEKFINEQCKNKIDKEREFVKYLSTQIFKISNAYIVNMMDHIFNNDSSSLKMLKSHFLIECNKLISLNTLYIRREMIDYIIKDINEISETIHKNAINAANVIDKKNEENRKKTQDILIMIGFSLASFISICFDSIFLSNIFAGLAGIKCNPLKQTNDPDKNNFVFKIGKKTFEASHDELTSYFKEITEPFGEKAKDFMESLIQSPDMYYADFSLINFEPRNYETYLEELIQKESNS